MSRASAMILAAGKGTRMRSHEAILPKPLVPIAGKPLLRYALDIVENSGLTSCVVNAHYKADQIEDYLATQTLPITLSHEVDLLETGGGIRHALPWLEEAFFTLNSDVICVESQGQPVLKHLEAAWDASRMDALLLLCPLERASGYAGQGDFSLSESGQILPRDEKRPAYVYMGIQKMHRRLITSAPESPAAFSLSPIFRAEIAKGASGRLYGMVHEGHWLHVGDKAGVEAAEAFLMQPKPVPSQGERVSI